MTGGGYAIEFPDYPGVLADGETPEEALAEGHDALRSYVETLRELGRPVPKDESEAACRGGSTATVLR